MVNRSPAGCLNPASTDARKITSVVPYQVKLDDTLIFASEWTYHVDDLDVKYTTCGARYHYSLTRPPDDTVAPIEQFTLPCGITARPQLTCPLPDPSV